MQVDEIVEAWIIALEDYESNVSDNIDWEDIIVEYEAFELERVPVQKTKDPTQVFVTRAQVQALNEDEVKNSTACNIAPVLTEPAEDKFINAQQAVQNAGKEGVESLLFNLVRKVIVEIIQQGKMHSQLMRRIDTLTRSERIMEALTPQVAR